MSEKVNAYIQRLKQLSNRELDASARSTALKEKKHTACLIAHLAEISSRKYHLIMGYKSLFEYCLKRLNLSEGSVALRIQVAQVCNRFPQILAALAGGQLHLSAAGLIAPHLKTENADVIIKEVAGKSKRQIKEYLVGFAPKAFFKPSMRKLPTINPKDAFPPTVYAAQAEQVGTVLSQRQAKRQTQSNIFEPAALDLYNVRFTANKNLSDKLKRLAEVIGIEAPEKQMDAILEKAVDIALDIKDPQRKMARRKKRNTKPRPDEVKEKKSKKAKTPAQYKKPSRYIAADVRERVFEKAEYRCEYRSPEGRRCSARTGLEIEHTRPFAVFQSHEETDLRLYCRAHNQLAAEQYFGREYIKRKIEAGRRKKRIIRKFG